MKKSIVLLGLLATIHISLFTVSYAFSSAPPTQEVEIIEKIASQTQEVVAEKQEKYEMKVLAEIPWGNKPGELGVLGGAPAPLPDRLAVDGIGNVYIFDKCNNRINKYNSWGKYVRDYKVDSLKVIDDSNAAEGARAVKNDIDMGVDDAGNIYILNSVTNKIRKIDSNGNIVQELVAPAGANYIRVNREGQVQAIKYVDSKIEIFNSTTNKTEKVNGFITPGGLNISVDDSAEDNKSGEIKISDRRGTLLKRISIKVPYKLFWIDFLGMDEKDNFYIVMERQSDETMLQESAPKKFERIRLLGYYIRKYAKNDMNLLIENKYIPIDDWLPGFNKCFSVGRSENIYMFTMIGSAYGGEGKFRIIKWEKK